MSSDELIVLIVCGIGAFGLWGSWLHQHAFIGHVDYARPTGTYHWIVPVVCAGLLFLVLKTSASFDVVSSPLYLAFYMVMGVFPQDFPSATYLRARGIDRALLVQASDTVRDDLAHVLLRWQQAGIALSIVDPLTTEPLRPLIVRTPRLYRRAWYRMLAILGLRRSNVGGFGAVIPIASSGGYG